MFAFSLIWECLTGAGEPSSVGNLLCFITASARGFWWLHTSYLPHRVRLQAALGNVINQFFIFLFPASHSERSHVSATCAIVCASVRLEANFPYRPRARCSSPSSVLLLVLVSPRHTRSTHNTVASPLPPVASPLTNLHCSVSVSHRTVLMTIALHYILISERASSLVKIQLTYHNTFYLFIFF